MAVMMMMSQRSVWVWLLSCLLRRPGVTTNWAEMIPGVLPLKIGMIPTRLPSKTSWRRWGMVRDWLFDGSVVGWLGLLKM